MPPQKHQIWLHKLFNSPYFDTWMCVSYMYRYPDIGIHQYICTKLVGRPDIATILPQLMHVMFHHSSTPVSLPIYGLLKNEARKEDTAMRIYFLLGTYKLEGEKDRARNSLIEFILTCRKEKKSNCEKLDRVVQKSKGLDNLSEVGRTIIEQSSILFEDESKNEQSSILSEQGRTIIEQNSILFGETLNKQKLIEQSSILFEETKSILFTNDNSIVLNDIKDKSTENKEVIDNNIFFVSKTNLESQNEMLNKNIWNPNMNETLINKEDSYLTIGNNEESVYFSVLEPNILDQDDCDHNNKCSGDKFDEVDSNRLSLDNEVDSNTNKNRLSLNNVLDNKINNDRLNLDNEVDNSEEVDSNIRNQKINNDRLNLDNEVDNSEEVDSNIRNQKINNDRLNLDNEVDSNIKNDNVKTHNVKNDKIKNDKINKNRLSRDNEVDTKKHRYSYRKFPFKPLNHKAILRPSINSMVLTLIKNVAFPFNPLPAKLRDFENNLKVFGQTPKKETLFSKTVSFYEKLVEIIERLKSTNKPFQSSALQIECCALQALLVHRVVFPLDPSRFVLSVCAEYCSVLCSAYNAPFVVVLETAHEFPIFSVEMKKETEMAILLFKQTKSLTMEMKSVRENVVEKIEKIKLEKKSVYLRGLTENESCNCNEINDSTIKDNTNLNNQLIKDNTNLNNQPINDNSTHKFKTTEIAEEVEKSSTFRSLRGYKVISLIVKSGPDFKQELLAFQLLCEIRRIWEAEGVKAWINCYEIYLINKESGLVEIVDGKSIHNIKKGKENKKYSLCSYYNEVFTDFDTAKANFLASLVGYSVITHLLQLKDRHNGNILVDKVGHIVHVDFGFILGEHPGFYMVETAPFKFGAEYAELLGNDLTQFSAMFLNAFSVLRKHSDRLCWIVEMLQVNSCLRCVNRNSIAAFRERFKSELSSKELAKHVNSIIDSSVSSMATGVYDSYQYYSNGYL